MNSPFLLHAATITPQLDFSAATPGAETAPTTPRCLVVSDHAMHRLTLEQYVAQSPDLHLVASLCDGVEAYEYLQRGGEADLVIIDLSSAGMHPEDIAAVTHDGRPRWLLIQEMGNVPAFSCEVADGRLAQPLCFSRFGQLVEQALAPLALAA